MTGKLRTDTERILEDAHHWLVLLEDPSATAEDRERFNTWLNADPKHADTYDSAITIRAALQTLDKNDIDNDLHYRPSKAWLSRVAASTESFLTSRKHRLAMSLGAATAAVLLFVSFLPSLFQAPGVTPDVTHYESATGEIRTISLADGTNITLGARTHIATHFDANQRVINLDEGAAYFDVAPDRDRPFSVRTSELTVTALGTAFEVRSSAAVFRVSVAEGNVEVRYPASAGGLSASSPAVETITAGQGLIATQEGGVQSISAVDIETIASWRSDRLIYNGASVAEFVGDLNRYSDIPITIDASARAVAERRVQGVFRSRDVESLLVSLTEIYPLEIDRSNASEIVLRARSR